MLLKATATLYFSCTKPLEIGQITSIARISEYHMHCAED